MIDSPGRSDRERVVITGLGVVTSLGIGAESFWETILAGKSGVSEITSFDTTGFSTRIAAEIKEWDPERYMERKEAKRMDRFVQFAVVASQLALADSGLQITPQNAEGVGVLIGSG